MVIRRINATGDQIETTIRLRETKWLFMLFWIRYTVIYWSCVILNQLPLMIRITPYIFPVLFILTMYVTLKIRNFSIDIWDLIIGILVAVGWFISQQLHPESKRYFESNADLFLQSFFMLYVGKSAFREGHDVSEDSLLITLSRMGVLFTALYFIYGSLTGRVTADEYMTISYRMLPSTLYIAAAFLRNVITKNTIWFIGTFLIQMFMGTRGAVLAIIVFIVLYIFLFARRKTFFVVLAFAIILWGLDSIFGLFTLLLKAVSSLCETLNMSTRIIDAILSESISNDNGRQVIYDYVLVNIRANIWTGRGLFADRYILEGMFPGGAYVHNFFIELWSHFGLIPACFMITIAIVLTFKTMLSKKLNQETKILLAIVFSSSITQLMFSGSYLTSGSFWLYLGVLWGIRKYQLKSKNRKLYDYQAGEISASDYKENILSD